MKTLLLMRHAKSSWKDPGLADHDRPLNKRGKENATAMGEFLEEQGLVPDLIFSSTATRAHTTAARVAAGCGYAGEVRLHEALYFEDPSSWVELIRDVAEDVGRLLVITHNPGIEDFLEMLTGEVETMPTAAVARIELPIESWREFGTEESGRLVNLWRPREL